MIGFDRTIKSFEKFDGMVKDYSDALKQTIAEMKDHKDDDLALNRDLEKISVIGANLSTIGNSISEGSNGYIDLISGEEDA